MSRVPILSGKTSAIGLCAEGPLLAWAQALAVTLRDCVMMTSPQYYSYRTQGHAGETQLHPGVSELRGFPALRYGQPISSPVAVLPCLQTPGLICILIFS